MAAIGIWALIALLATSIVSLPTNKTDSLATMRAALKTHEGGLGFSHLGDDGVLRSFHPNGSVIDYIQLAPEHIQRMLQRWGKNDYLAQVFDGVDGRNVTDEKQLWYPGEHLLPLPFLPKTNLTSNETEAVRDQCTVGEHCPHTPEISERGTHPKHAAAHHAQALHATEQLVSDLNRICNELRCRSDYHCYGMHPSCDKCVYVDQLKNSGGLCDQVHIP